MSDYWGLGPLNTTNGNVAENWKLWRRRFENFLKASEIAKKDEATQCAQLLHYIGEGGFKIYTTFKIPKNQQDQLGILFDKFEKHFMSKDNITHERYKLFTYKQQSGQSLAKYIRDVKNRAVKCKLGDLSESLTKVVVIAGVKNNLIRENILEFDNLSLDETVEVCLKLDSLDNRSKNTQTTKTVFQASKENLEYEISDSKNDDSILSHKNKKVS